MVILRYGHRDELLDNEPALTMLRKNQVSWLGIALLLMYVVCGWLVAAPASITVTGDSSTTYSVGPTDPATEFTLQRLAGTSGTNTSGTSALVPFSSSTTGTFAAGAHAIDIVWTPNFTGTFTMSGSSVVLDSTNYAPGYSFRDPPRVLQAISWGIATGTMRGVQYR